ncbi:MAG TPA: metal-sulfur cluster assembly factor [Actinomycetota bacterium]|nr:metal-sulfur cluster assembly factor [Actinomycetota bacterium]
MTEFMDSQPKNQGKQEGGVETPDEQSPTAAAVDRATGNGDASSLKERVLEVLKNVHDPELGVNIVDLGLVYGVEIEDGTVHVTYTLTTMGCPIGPLIEAEMKQFLSGVEGIDEVNAEMVLRPPWTPEMMSEEAKAALGYF